MVDLSWKCLVAGKLTKGTVRIYKTEKEQKNLIGAIQKVCHWPREGTHRLLRPVHDVSD